MTRNDQLGLLLIATFTALGSACSSNAGGGESDGKGAGGSGAVGGAGASTTGGQIGTTGSGGAGSGGSAGTADGGAVDAAMGTGGGGPRGSAGADGGVDGSGSGGGVAQPPGNSVTFSTSRLVGVASGRCLGVVGASTANNAAVELQACNGSAFQSWTVAQAATGYATLINGGEAPEAAPAVAH